MEKIILLAINLFCGAAMYAQRAPAKKVSYDLYVKDTTVNYTGKHRHAIAINGKIPGPTIELTQGDTAVIRVHNMMKVMTSIHWHGIMIPNQYDGVPGLTTFSIEPNTSLTVIFPVRQNGTYWYHSHTMTQEQIGLTGSIVIHKKNEPKMNEEVLVLNDWTNLKPSNVWRMLKSGTDFFEIKKNSVQSYGEALAAGHLGDKIKQEWMRMPAMDVSDVHYNLFLMNGKPAFEYGNYKAGDSIKLRIINASSSSYFWLQYAGGQMKIIAADGQDVEPVDVDKFLMATAETYDVVIKIPASGKYELRASVQDISGHTSAFFGNGTVMPAPTIPKIDYFSIMHHMNMMSSMDMEMGAGKMPMTNKEIHHEGMNNMQMNHMTMDKDTSMKKMQMHDMDMHQDTTIPEKKKMPARPQEGNDMDNMKGMEKSDMQMPARPSGGDNMQVGNMEMPARPSGGYAFSYPPGNGDDKVLSYAMLKAANNDSAIAKPMGEPDRIIVLTATGNMFRYVWSFNNKTLTDADKILIKKGEHVRVIFHNNTMMEHPLHLHGHFFRLLNGSSLDEAPLKHTFNLMPMATDTIDFAADGQKDWFFHCHTLYHMMSGMARTFHYENTLPEVQKESPKDYKHFLKEHGRHAFLWGASSFQSQGNFTDFTVAGTKWEINEEFKWDYKSQYESETMFRRFLDRKQFFAIFLGTDNRQEEIKGLPEGKQQFESTNLATFGATYFLPLLVMAEGRIDQTGHFRFQLSRHDLALTKRARFDFSWNTDKQYTLGLKYIVARNLALSGNYDSDYGWGAGISFVY